MKTFDYTTPNDGIKQIRVHNIGGHWEVGYFDTVKGSSAPKFVHLAPACDASTEEAAQALFEKWANKRHLTPAHEYASSPHPSSVSPQPSPADAALPARRGPGRPPRVLAILGKHSERMIISQIVRLHAISAASAAATGYWLLLAKETVSYGDWQKWITDNLPCSLRTAYGYMELATMLMPKIPNGIGHEKIGELLESICGGKTAHQFLFQLKEERKPLPAGAKSEADLTPDERTKLEFEGAKKEAVWLGQQVNDWLHKTKGYMRLDDDTRAGLADLFNEAHEVLKSTLE